MASSECLTVLRVCPKGLFNIFVDFGSNGFTEIPSTVRRSPCDNSRHVNSLYLDTGLHASSNVGPNDSSALVPGGSAGISKGGALLRGHGRATRWRSKWHEFLDEPVAKS